MKKPVMRCTLLGKLILIAAVCAVPAHAELPFRKTKAERFLSKGAARPEGPAKWFYIEGITAPVNTSPNSLPAVRSYKAWKASSRAAKGKDAVAMRSRRAMSCGSFGESMS